MDLSSSYTFDAPRSVVWKLLNDPTLIADCLPGCESMDPSGDDSFRVVLTVAIAAISGRYEGTVTIADPHEPSDYRLVITGTGRAGFVKGEADISLAELENDADRTLVTVDSRAQVGGTIARVGQRLLGSVSKMMMDRFFACLATKAASSPTD